MTAENTIQSPPTYDINCQNYIVSIRCTLDFHFILWPLVHKYFGKHSYAQNLSHLLSLHTCVQSLGSEERHHGAVTWSIVIPTSQFLIPNISPLLHEQKCLATFDNESFRTVTVNSEKLRVPSAIQTLWSVQKQVDKDPKHLSYCSRRKCYPTNLTCASLANTRGESNKQTGEGRCDTQHVYLVQAHCIFCETGPCYLGDFQASSD
jgi:hypothetical protein